MQTTGSVLAHRAASHRWVRLPLVAMINVYQRYLSPLKGYRCAHRTLHGGDSCSQFVKQALLRQSLAGAFSSSRRRFAQCAEAHAILAEAQRPERPEEEGARRDVGKDAGQKCFLLPASMCCISGFALK